MIATISLLLGSAEKVAAVIATSITKEITPQTYVLKAKLTENFRSTKKLKRFQVGLAKKCTGIDALLVDKIRVETTTNDIRKIEFIKSHQEIFPDQSKVINLERTKKDTTETRAISFYKAGQKRKALNIIEKLIDEHRELSKETLGFIVDPFGYTVAHIATRKGYIFSDPDILKLTGENRSDQNAVFGHSGCSVAFLMAKKNIMIKDKEILSLGSGEKQTPAHALAMNGRIFSDPDILSLSDDRGNTVAHIMAMKGHVFSDQATLSLKNKYGVTVREFIANNQLKEEHL